ncbi:restriction endonuclease subunit S [Intestinimonas massiliensis (ex Afouda et al. 2020)]|uniref:restriction endonuclease subunit S n=1 Tax=Intestinimonas massiliensis (ex Afouda et al. 2020) TaxID=1673721 RepID=UPI001031D1E0|nr:restriction endonuclease subunit S [Intestinimonas massiliensis (ex Afouda et al. 2020)]
MARLEDICSINMGQSPESSSYNESGEGMPFFQGNADFGELHPKVRIWCNAPAKIAECGDILISVRAPIGALNIADKQCCIGRGLAALTVNETLCSPKYLWYGLECKVDELNSKGTGSTFKAINKKTLAETEIPLPPLEEQCRIAATLDKVSDLIAKRRAQLDKLDLLVKARFVEMFGDPEINPMNWLIVEIGSVIKSIDSGWSGNGKQREKKAGEIAVLKVSAVTKGYFIPEECKVLDDQENIKKYVSPQKGDLLFSRANTKEMVGATAIIREDYPELILPDKLWKIRFSDVTNVIYMKYILSSQTIRNKFSAASTGTSGSMYNVSMEKFKAIQIPMPEISIQNQFASFAESVEKSKLTIQRSLDKLEALKKALMQQYFG